MKVWVLEHRSVVYGDLMWIGSGLGFTDNLTEAVQFVRRVDAERVLADNPLLNAQPVEKELPSGGEPRAQPAASQGANSKPEG